MYVKLSFEEQTIPRCMSLNLTYMLAENPTIIDTPPSGAEANKQVRIPDEPALNGMFGLANACHYDYYLDCGDATKETIAKTLHILSAMHDGKLPLADADQLYISENKNLIVDMLNVALEIVKRNKEADNQSLQEMLEKSIQNELQKREKENMKIFFRSLMKSDEKEASQELTSEQEDSLEEITSLMMSNGKDDSKEEKSKKEESIDTLCFTLFGEKKNLPQPENNGRDPSPKKLGM